MNTNSHSTEASPSAPLASTLDAFAEQVRSIARSRAVAVRADPERDLRFALIELLPSRVRAIKDYLKVDAEDVEPSLHDFTAALVGALSAEAAESRTPCELADAVVQALEDLHSFVLAHDLVDRRYRLSQGIGWRPSPSRRRLLSRSPQAVFRGIEAAAAGADAHEYALAA